MSLWPIIIAAVCVLLLAAIVAVGIVQNIRVQKYENAISAAWGRADEPTLEVSDTLGPLTGEDSRAETRRMIDLVARVSSGVKDPPPGGEFVASFPETNANVHVYKFGSVWGVAFRGTSSLEEMKLDFRMEQTEFGTGRVHSGFHCVYSKFKTQLLETLRGAKKIVIGGHSLGGALAHLLAYDLPVSSLVYTFGSPKVGDSNFASALNDRAEVFRYVNNFDIICDLPMTVMPNLKRPDDLLQYIHAGISRDFSKFNGSWKANHTLKLYAAHL
jgi:hypothetical protein